MITAELITHPWVYITHKGMEMTIVELTTYPWVYTTHTGMEMITTELATYPWVYTTHKGMDSRTNHIPLGIHHLAERNAKKKPLIFCLLKHPDRTKILKQNRP